MLIIHLKNIRVIFLTAFIVSSVAANAHFCPVLKTDSTIKLEGAAEDSVSCIIPFSRIGNLIFIRAKADTADGNFILDTGAPGLVLNLTYFRDYPVIGATTEEQTGSTGTVSAVVKTEVHSFNFGCIKADRVPADLVNLGHLENVKGVRILGLIGLSFFRRFEVIIDYENSLLYLHRIGKKEAATYKNSMLNDTAAYTIVPVEIRNEKIIAISYIAGKKLRINIDSGAEISLLDSRLPGNIFDNVEIIKKIRLNGTGDRKVEALYGNLNNLTIGNRHTGSLPVIITNLEGTCFGDTNCIDGVLGFDFLSLYKIGFNFVNNQMYIWK